MHTAMLESWSQIIIETLKAITAFFNSDPAKLLVTLSGRLSFLAKRPGLYEVLRHDVRLELLDSQGEKAIYYKRQKVRFLHDEIFAIQDQAWGDGNPFAAYKCSPGFAVDRYKVGYRWKILISLRDTRNRGDEEEFLIERTIHNGFTTPVGNFQTQIDHLTDHLTINVIFPAARHPKNVTGVEQNTKRAYPLGKEHIIRLSGERVQYRWSVNNPRLYEAYILRWEW